MFVLACEVSTVPDTRSNRYEVSGLGCQTTFEQKASTETTFVRALEGPALAASWISFNCASGANGRPLSPTAFGCFSTTELNASAAARSSPNSDRSNPSAKLEAAAKSSGGLETSIAW